jgi:hypothetical protein
VLLAVIACCEFLILVVLILTSQFLHLSRIGVARLSDENGILYCSLLWLFILNGSATSPSFNDKGLDKTPEVSILLEPMAGVELYDLLILPT